MLLFAVPAFAIPAVTTPPNIVTDYNAWVAWKDARIAAFESAAPSARTNTYYFAAAGSDGEDCSIITPCATRNKCATLITTNSGDTRCRFKSGDTWDDNSNLVITANNVTIDAYGTGAKPFFNAFTLKYNASGWTLAAGNRYTRTEANDVAWLRDQDDRLGDTLGQNLVRVANSTDCEALTNSWVWVSGTLHINLGPSVNPNSRNLEAVISNSNNGVEFGGDGGRVEGIRADGFGMSRTVVATQAQPFTNRSSGSNANYFKNLEGYYSGSHVIAHNRTGSGGISMFNGVTAGYPKFASGESIFNTYSSDGLQETWFLDITCKYGTLKSSDWAYLTAFQRGQVYYGHTAGAIDTGLTVAFNTSLVSSHTPAMEFGNFPRITVPSVDTDFTQYRSFIVNTSQPSFGNALAQNLQWGANTIIYGLNYKAILAVGGVGAHSNYTPNNVWLINSYLELDHSVFGNGYSALYNTLVTGNSIHFLQSAVKLTGANLSGVTSFGMDFDNGFNAALAIGAGASANSSSYNSIFSYEDIGASTRVWLGLTNTAAALKNNAYYGVDQNAGFENGYDNDAGRVTLASPYVLNVSQAGLLLAGSSTITASHDINGKRRTVSPPDIGPEDFSSPGGVTNGGAIFKLIRRRSQ